MKILSYSLSKQWVYFSKAAIILLIVAFNSLNLQAQDQKISLPKGQITILSAFEEIEKQAKMTIAYNESVINVKKTINISVVNNSLADAMTAVLKGTNTTYVIQGKQIIIVAAIPKEVSEKKYAGTIIDAMGDPIIGASVKLKNSSTVGTITDIDGKFEINAPSNSVLTISYVGFHSQEIRLDGQTTLNIKLNEDNTQLNEVVVVGYGIQKRIHLTGSVAQIGAEDITKAPLQNISNALTGKLPGLTSIQRSGLPGSDGATMHIRGRSSFATDTAPLVIVDGVPRPMDTVNPNDIESVSILKDASASIYGVNGANGVILIITKRGGEGPAKISYDGSTSFVQNTAMPEMLNAADYMYWHNKARAMDGLNPLWTANIQNKVMNNDPNSVWGQTDWMDKIFRTGLTQQHNVSASGGTQKSSYFASLGIMDQEGTLKNTEYKRYNIRTNIDVQVAKNLRFTANIAGYRADRNWPGTAISNQGEFNPVRQAITSIPILKSDYQGYPVAWNGSTYLVNGYAALNESGFKKQKRWGLDSNFKLEYDFSGLTSALKGLKASMFGAYNYNHTTDSNYDRSYDLYYVNSTFDEGIGSASGFSQENAYSKSSSWGDTYLVRPQIEYSQEFDDHHISAIFLYEASKSFSSTMTGTKKGYYSDDPVDLSLGTTFPENAVTGSYAYSGGIASWVGRFNYAYKNRYLGEVGLRRDGTYIFPPENRWGSFLSASAGWVVSEEPFFSELFPKIDYLKLRASWGQSGNNETPANQYLSLFSVANNSMVFGGSPLAQFYSTNSYVYRNLTWAKTDKYNLGLDFNMWNGKLGAEIDVFYLLTTDMLEAQSAQYPTSLGGYYPQWRNSGKFENKGFEILLKHDNRINKDWGYSLKGSFAFARNRILARAVGDNVPNYRSQIGESVGAIYGFNAIGLFQTQDEIDNYPAAPSGNIRLGDLKYQDVNGDGIISAEYDYVKMGYGTLPEISFSMNMDVSYKNFSLSMLWQGVTNTDYQLSGVYDTGVISSTVYTASFPESGNSPYYRIEGAWTPENTDAKYPRLSTVSNGNNAWQSSWWLVNGEYLRLKNLNIGYSIPQSVLRNTPFSRVNIYLAGSNLLTFSHFKYIDPESPSVSNGYYPQQKTYSIGLNVSF